MRWAPIIALALALSLSIPAEARTFRAKITRVKDGDTIETDRLSFGVPEVVRLYGINTPEIHSAKCPEERAAGEAARLYLENLAASAGWAFSFADPFNEKFGRKTSKHIRFTINGKRVDPSAALIAAGHGVPYKGEARPPLFWCERLAPKQPANLIPPGF